MKGQCVIRIAWYVALAVFIPYTILFTLYEPSASSPSPSAAYAAQAQAAEPVFLRASLTSPGPVLVGERVPVSVELLTVTTFASAPVFELPTLSGALLMQMEERPVLGTEDIDGEGYTVQRHELAFFAMRPGITQVPPFTVRFDSPPRFGEEPVERRLTTPALQVEARLPPGAESLSGIIVTRELRVEQTWQPQPQSAHVGDAFTRTVTLTAPDVPGMVFPSLPLAKVAGLAVYPKPPIVQDHAERGDFTGKRIETITYVCERPGQFTLPALAIPWWDLENQQLMRVTLPAVSLVVEPGPASNPGVATPAESALGRHWLWWSVGVVLLVAGLVAVIWSRRGMLLAAWERRRMRREASEPGQFARLLKACRTGQAREAYNALIRWLDARQRGSDTATVEAFLTCHPDTGLRQQVEALQESVLGREAHWDGMALADGLRRARRQDLRRRSRARATGLPDLNPR